MKAQGFYTILRQILKGGDSTRVIITSSLIFSSSEILLFCFVVKSFVYDCKKVQFVIRSLTQKGMDISRRQNDLIYDTITQSKQLTPHHPSPSLGVVLCRRPTVTDIISSPSTAIWEAVQFYFAIEKATC